MPCDASSPIAYSMFYFSGPMGIQCSFMYRLKKNHKQLREILDFVFYPIEFNHVWVSFVLLKKIFDVNSVGGQTLSNQSPGGFKDLYLTETFLAMFTPFISTLTFPVLNYSKSASCKMLVQDLTS